jgi:hypothetical protein
LVYHGSILEAIERGDAAAARTAMEEHLTEAAQVWADRDIDQQPPQAVGLAPDRAPGATSPATP